MVNSQIDKHDIDQRRKAARKTAWKLAIVAFIFFAAFLYMGIVGR
jgi:hypothetical protein